MERNEILIKLEGIFRDVFDNSKIVLSETVTSSDIDNWDSLHALCLFNEIEDLFGISLSLDETMKMKSVATIIDTISNHVN